MYNITSANQHSSSKRSSYCTVRLDMHEYMMITRFSGFYGLGAPGKKLSFVIIKAF